MNKSLKSILWSLTLVLPFIAIPAASSDGITEERIQEITKRLEPYSPDELLERREFLINALQEEDSDSEKGSATSRTSMLLELSIVEQLLIALGILMIDDIDDYWKILLMMGIGVFISHKSIKYMEIMKRLASTQSLYLIIASSDFIYGTNYQFCHGYISNDLKNISQEKIIQAMGRVGRGKIQQDYSFRFRNNQNIYKLFKYAKDKPEILNMNRLFS